MSATAAGGSAGQGQYSETYGYDQIGNLTNKAGVAYTYQDPAHKHAVTHLGGVQKYWYDANGNMTTRVVGGYTYEQTWDAENRLVEVKESGVVVASYVYDGDGNRVQATVNGEVTSYIGNYAEYSDSSAMITNYYYAGGERVAMRFHFDDPSYLLGDHLGSTAITTNSSGTKTSELRYKAYGETRYAWGMPPTDFRFTGQKLDFSTGLYQMGARWYDPYLNRWIQPDTIIPDPSNPQSFNRYSYALANPLCVA